MIIVAIDNDEIYNKIKLRLGENIYSFDIVTKEEVIMLIEKIKEQKKYDKLVIVTKENLDGKLSDEEYIKQIKILDKDTKIIWNTTKLLDKDKQMLLGNEIFNIIIGEEFNVNKIIDSINNDDKIVYETNVENYNVNDNSNNNEKFKVFNREFIAVYGTNGSGKSYISNLLSKNIAKDIVNNICMVDMDFENSCIDILNNIDFKDKGISAICQNIDLNRNITDNINSNIVKKNKIDFILNNTTIYDYKNKINTQHYFKIYNELNKRYQTVIVDLPSFPFIDVVSFTLNYATKVIFVVNANYISLRQSVSYLELLNKHFNIPKNSINIIINKVSKNSLSLNYIKNILNDYNIILEVPFNENEEDNINNNFCNNKNNIDIDKIFNSKINKPNKIKEIKILNTFFNIFKERSLRSDHRFS